MQLNIVSKEYAVKSGQAVLFSSDLLRGDQQRDASLNPQNLPHFGPVKVEAGRARVPSGIRAGGFVVLIGDAYVKRKSDGKEFRIPQIAFFDAALSAQDVSNGVWNLSLDGRSIYCVQVLDDHDRPMRGASLVIQERTPRISTFQTVTDDDGNVFLFSKGEDFVVSVPSINKASFKVHITRAQ